MKLIKQLPILAFTIGMPFAHAQAPHGGIVSPFGPTPAATAPATPATASINAAVAGAALPSMSLAQAKAALVPAASKKIQPALLDAILRGEQRDVIVMFKDQSGAAGVKQAAQRLAIEKNAYSTTRRSVHAALGAANVAFLREYEYLPMAFVRVHSNAALLGLLNHPMVASVVENVSVRAQTAESLPLIHQPQAIATGRRGAGAVVAVLDTGVDVRSEVFGKCGDGIPSQDCRIVATYDATGQAFPTSGPVMHGTIVARIVAQVAPGAKLALVNVHAKGEEGADTNHMLAGINWVIAKKEEHNIVSLNLSVGVPDFHPSIPLCTPGPGTLYDVMHTAFARLRSKNILPVVSAGNHYVQNKLKPSYPACAASDETEAEPAAVVGALYDSLYTHDGKGCKEIGKPNRITCFSARSAEVNIAAPGGYPDTGGGYRDVTGGTSFSAPHVAAAVAVLRAPDAAPGDSLAQTLGRLTNTGYDIRVSDPTLPPTTRMPRLDLMASLNSVFHISVTQQFYVSLLGRPADPAGLRAFAQGLGSTGAPSTIVDLNRLYDYSAPIRALVDGVGTSAEASALYPGDNGAFVTAMYQNILNREPDAGSLAHWRGQLDRGETTRGRAALAIAATAAQYKEGATLYKRAAVANNFTNALDLPVEVAAYQRSTAEARTLVKSVDAVTDIDVMDGFIDSAIRAMLNR